MSQPPMSLSRLRVALHTRWIRTRYPFHAFGTGNSVHHSCQLDPNIAKGVSFGSGIYVGKDCWINAVAADTNPAPSIIVGNGCRIGRRNVISARNLIQIEDDVLFAPGVLLMDHSHQYSDVNLPIHAQGLTGGGTIVVERNCWIGYGAAVLSTHGELRIGRNTIIGANAVVRSSLPPFSVAVGNPAKVVKRFDPGSGEWVRVEQNDLSKGLREWELFRT
jgi:abequosyltransferase